MTREQAKEMLPIIQAFADGKEVEVSAGANNWATVGDDPSFNCSTKYYRIKPQPRDLWIVECDGGRHYSHAFASEAEANAAQSESKALGHKNIRLIHVREVI